MRRPRRVLVVDDHPSFRRCARSLLTEEGFEVVGEAGEGAEALVLAAELEPDFVLLDVQLPDLDGFEVASPPRADGELAIVLVSSRDRSPVRAARRRRAARAVFVGPRASSPASALERLLE